VVHAIERAEQHGRNAAAALAPTIKNLAMLRRQLEMGCSVESILEFMSVTGGAEKRRAADEAIHRSAHAVVELRALMMQALVAESGSRLSEVAQKMGIPSEQVAQLCGMGRAIPEQSEEQSEEN
jgi:hypothetical protein